MCDACVLTYSCHELCAAYALCVPGLHVRFSDTNSYAFKQKLILCPLSTVPAINVYVYIYICIYIYVYVYIYIYVYIYNSYAFIQKLIAGTNT